MNILVIGSGAREHAMVWKCVQSDFTDRVFCAPGNAGIGMIAELVDVAADDIESLASFAKENRIDLSIVGPEAPLMAGIADRFAQEGLCIFGPSRQGALLEGSKFFCKMFLRRQQVPTADFRLFAFVNDAKAYLKERGAPCVIKANGLASGKGVDVAKTIDEALAAVERIAALEGGKHFLIEECLNGWECSYTVVTDGRTRISFPVARDYKQLYSGGPNTGGMGGYSPVPAVTEELQRLIEETIVRPTIAGLQREGIPYRGVLYFGLMITESGPYVLEINCRFGDPEAQILLPRLKSDLVKICYAAAQGNLASVAEVEWSNEYFVNVVLAAHGYPERPQKGLRIHGLEDATEEGLIFQAETRKNSAGNFVTCGGRALSVVGHGATMEKARAMAYRMAERVRFGKKGNPKQVFRHDIASYI